MEIITGYTGENHVTSMDDASLYRGIFGQGDYVLDVGNKFKATIIDNSTVRIMDGDLVIQGHQARIRANDYEEVTIDNGTPGQKRNDLIVARYQKNTTTGIESITLEVVKGTPGETATDPEIIQEDLTIGGIQRDYPLYRVSLNGLVLESVTSLFTVLPNFEDFMTHKADYEDLKGYIGYTENDIYGVEADFVNNKFTRLAGAVGKTPGADFDGINAFGGRKRCNLADNGTVNAYYGDAGYKEDGSNGQVMVEQPKFYYKVVPLQLEKIQDGKGYHMRKARYYISDTPKPGFKVHPAFVRNRKEVEKIYLSAYEGCIYDVSARTYLLNDKQVADFTSDKLSSIAYTKPASGLTQNLTRANARKLANNRGTRWQISDVLSAAVTQLLFIIEYASFNMQSNIGLGVVSKTDDGSTNMSELTGATTNLGNTSGMAVGTNGLVSVTYRGEENFWGNIWYWIDGLNIEIGGGVHDAWYTDYGFTDDIKTSPYKNTGFTLAKRNGYVSAIGWSETCDFLFLPTETLGDSSLPIGDYFYQDHASSGWRVSQLGGLWHIGSDAGGFYWGVFHSSAFRSRGIGGRLLYVPQS